MYLTKLIELVRENPDRYEGRKYKLIVDKDFNLEMEVVAGKIKCNNKSESEIRVVGINDVAEEIVEPVDFLTAAKDYLANGTNYVCVFKGVRYNIDFHTKKMIDAEIYGKFYKEDKS